MTNDCLPAHGRVNCSRCYVDQFVEFDATQRTEGNWRITANPLAWGGRNPEVVVLGFSKGSMQTAALEKQAHDAIAFAGGRTQLGKILSHVGLIESGTNEELKRQVDALIANQNGRFHFGSLIRCTVQQWDGNKWGSSGNGMLDKFVATPFGKSVVSNCVRRFLVQLPASVRLVILLGLGKDQGYVEAAKNFIRQTRLGAWKDVNRVAYTDGKVTFVHTEHFKAQGALLPQWLGQKDHPRRRFGELAREAVQGAFLSRGSEVSQSGAIAKLSTEGKGDEPRQS